MAYKGVLTPAALGKIKPICRNGTQQFDLLGPEGEINMTYYPESVDLIEK